MSMDAPRGRVLCDRARSWAALVPDRELSELERKLLDRHLANCADCCAFADEVVEVTELIRRQELVALSEPVSVPSWSRRRGISARLGTVGAAAAVALMAIGIASRAPLPTTTDESRASQLPRITNYANNVPREVAQIQQLRKVYPTPQNVLKLRPAMQDKTLPA
jgi:ferric-dicitrate binding protein FerR (iron transport regulator)